MYGRDDKCTDENFGCPVFFRIACFLFPGTPKFSQTEKPEFGPLGLHFGRVFGPCWRYVGTGFGAHENRILRTCTSRLASDMPTWPNLSPSWVNLGPAWTNLALLDTISMNFAGHLDTLNQTKITIYLHDQKFLICAWRFHGSIIFKVPGPPKIIEKLSKVPPKNRCDVEPFVDEPQHPSEIQSWAQLGPT